MNPANSSLRLPRLSSTPLLPGRSPSPVRDADRALNADTHGFGDVDKLWTYSELENQLQDLRARPKSSNDDALVKCFRQLLGRDDTWHPSAATINVARERLEAQRPLFDEGSTTVAKAERRLFASLQRETADMRNQLSTEQAAIEDSAEMLNLRDRAAHLATENQARHRQVQQLHDRVNILSTEKKTWEMEKPTEEQVHNIRDTLMELDRYHEYTAKAVRLLHDKGEAIERFQNVLSSEHGD